MITLHSACPSLCSSHSLHNCWQVLIVNQDFVAGNRMLLWHEKVEASVNATVQSKYFRRSWSYRSPFSQAVRKFHELDSAQKEAFLSHLKQCRRCISNDLALRHILFRLQTKPQLFGGGGDECPVLLLFSSCSRVLSLRSRVLSPSLTFALSLVPPQTDEYLATVRLKRRRLLPGADSEWVCAPSPCAQSFSSYGGTS